MRLPGRTSVAIVAIVAIGVMTCAALLPAPLPALPAPPGKDETPRRIPGTEQVHVDLVLIDLVVRDRNDQPVTGLTRDDFDLIIDGVAVKPADIESFEEVCGAQEPSALPARTAGAPGSTPLPEPAAAAPAGVRHIVIYFDFTHMTTGAARLAMRGAKDYLARSLAPEDRVMILADSNGLRLVQDFTSDGPALIARIDTLLEDKGIVATDVMGEDRYIVEVKETPCNDLDCSSRRAISAAYAGQEEMRGRRTLDYLTSLMPALAGMKGRKALVLFTEALRMEPGAQYYALTDATPREEGYLLERELLRLASEANAAGVSFYTVHAGGLTADLEPTRPTRLSGPKQSGVDSAHDLQITLATETGGRALRNSNDVGAILGTAERDLSCYYLLGYRYQGRGDNKRHSI
ncbi:MAG TPA: VWA domain-containing protein, partial [Patescibacteria group bacterium]|nr:VWA domain-containing protein [Patescibacteria group bacterium]